MVIGTPNCLQNLIKAKIDISLEGFCSISLNFLDLETYNLTKSILGQC